MRVNWLLCFFLGGAVCCAAALLGCTTPSSSSDAGPPEPGPAGQGAPNFFVTSVGTGKGGNLGGLAGADAHCNKLAKQAGLSGIWKAYLSTSKVNARDRIGKGPWFNVKGVLIANNLQELHDDSKNRLSKETGLSEKGAVISGYGDKVNKHDILTGSKADGTVDGDKTCSDWTSSEDGKGAVTVGHHDRKSGRPFPTANSWNASHSPKGCSLDFLAKTGGAGLFYCFKP